MALPSALAKQLEEQGRYILAANLAVGRRVLDIGRGYPSGFVALAEAGAESLTARSHEPEQLIAELDAAGLEGTAVDADAPLPLPYEDGAFNLVICHDLPALLTQDFAWEQELRRILSADGYLVASVANPAGAFISELAGERFESDISYEDFVGIFQPHFTAVSVFGQSPLTASLFFDFADESEEPGLVLDRSLLPDEPEQPGWYICIFGPDEYHRDDMNIVQLPYDGMLAASMEARQHAQAEAPHHSRRGADHDDAEHDDGQTPAPIIQGVDPAALEHAERLVRALEAELQMARTQATAAHDALHARPTVDPQTVRTLQELQQAHETTQKKLAKVSTELDGREEAIVHLEQALEQSERNTNRLEKEMGSNQDAIAHLKVDLADAHRMLAEARTAHQEAEVLAQAAQAMSAQSDALQLRVKTLEDEASELRQGQGRLVDMDQELIRARHDRASFEAQIRDLLEEVTAMRKRDEVMQNELQSARDALQTSSAQAAQDKAVMEHEHARLEAELAQKRQTDVAAMAVPTPLSKPHDAIGRELDTAVEELEDLLKDVAPPISTGR